MERMTLAADERDVSIRLSGDYRKLGFELSKHDLGGFSLWLKGKVMISITDSSRIHEIKSYMSAYDLGFKAGLAKRLIDEVKEDEKSLT